MNIEQAVTMLKDELFKEGSKELSYVKEFFLITSRSIVNEPTRLDYLMNERLSIISYGTKFVLYLSSMFELEFNQSWHDAIAKLREIHGTPNYGKSEALYDLFIISKYQDVYREQEIDTTYKTPYSFSEVASRIYNVLKD